MNAIRKIWIGKSIKEDSMSWEIGQKVRISKNPSAARATINHIIKEDDSFTIYVKKENGSIVKWKDTDMDSTREYDLDF